MRSIAVRAALLLGCALLAPSVRADIVPEDPSPRGAPTDLPRWPRPPWNAAKPGTSATVKVIVVVGGLVLAGILIALLYRRRDPTPVPRGL